ncbi:MAG: ABC transporter ATP-binding protein, partial [Chthoniobacterales bacterium]|nr:ABC transporter ATP-binding protein [Chthoniobacterales bacterium]
MNNNELLKVEDLSISFLTASGSLQALRNVSFSIPIGGSVAIVGESGSGKSVTALALTRLLPSPPARYEKGKIFFRGRNTLDLSQQELRKIRGGGIAYIFQEPSTSHNPVFSIRSQIAEAIRLHRPEVKEIDEEIIRCLESVGIRDAARRMHDYPHQFSGGMQQRAMIAMALACRPDLLVADEPTTALDVTVQAQILEELLRLRQIHRMALLLITHNFAIIRGLCDQVVVMWRGRVVECGETELILQKPRHPYTQALLECIPRLGRGKGKLKTIDTAELEKRAADYE